jgi:ABC-type branched-subunit amino acid transport system ATPase component
VANTDQIPAGLSVQAVRVSYGGLVALDDVSLDIERGDVVGLIGPNGSGKTTLLNSISGAQQVDSGRILVEGTLIDGRRAYQRARCGVARTFQTLRLFDSLSVIDNIVLGAHRQYRHTLFESCLHTPRARRERREQRDRAIDLVAVFGTRLLPRLDQQVTTLSYANRRRVEISRAFMAEPRLLLLDEPAAGMNPAETEELAEHLELLAKRSGCTMLIVEHKLEFIESLCSSVFVLDHGVQLAHGRSKDIRADPRVREAFLGVE